MTVKTYFGDTTVLTSTARYFVVTNKGREWAIGRKDAAHIRNDPEFPYGWTVERRVVTSEVPACPWCAARPEEFEMDCDGYSGTGTCGSPQCDQLKVCEGCGEFGVQNWGSWRGRLCDPCHTVASEKFLAVIPGEYGLFPWEVYREYYDH